MNNAELVCEMRIFAGSVNVRVGITLLEAARRLEDLAAENAALREALAASEAFRVAYRNGKDKLYAMGGAVAEAALTHLPCNEGGLESAVRELLARDGGAT